MKKQHDFVCDDLTHVRTCCVCGYTLTPSEIRELPMKREARELVLPGCSLRALLA